MAMCVHTACFCLQKRLFKRLIGVSDWDGAHSGAVAVAFLHGNHVPGCPSRKHFAKAGVRIAGVILPVAHGVFHGAAFKRKSGDLPIVIENRITDCRSHNRIVGKTTVRQKRETIVLGAAHLIAGTDDVPVYCAQHCLPTGDGEPDTVIRCVGRNRAVCAENIALASVRFAETANLSLYLVIRAFI